MDSIIPNSFNVNVTIDPNSIMYLLGMFTAIIIIYFIAKGFALSA
jgi:hypothetical protein